MNIVNLFAQRALRLYTPSVQSRLVKITVGDVESDVESALEYGSITTKEADIILSNRVSVVNDYNELVDLNLNGNYDEYTEFLKFKGFNV